MDVLDNSLRLRRQPKRQGFMAVRHDCANGEAI
jgi:hypothetical protein